MDSFLYSVQPKRQAAADKSPEELKEALLADSRTQAITKKQAGRAKPNTPPSPRPKTDAPESGQSEDFKLDLTSNALFNAIILSQALGRPKCKRKGR